MNSGVDPHLCSWSYVKVDQVVDKLLEMGPSVQLAKLDVNSVYRNVPVHPEDRLTGYTLARSGLRGCDSAFWFEVSTENLQLLG